MDGTPAVTVDTLADRQDLVTPLARLRWREWGGHPGREDVRWWIDTTAGESAPAGLPVTFAAVDADGEIAGGVGLIATEHPELADRGPWVVGMIVREPLRGRGVGAVLMARLTEWAGDAGIDRLWVVANGRAVDFYRKFGFTTAEVVTLAYGDRPTLLTAPTTDPTTNGPRPTS